MTTLAFAITAVLLDKFPSTQLVLCAEEMAEEAQKLTVVKLLQRFLDGSRAEDGLQPAKAPPAKQQTIQKEALN